MTLCSSKPSSSNFLSSDRWFILLEEPISQSVLQGIQLAKVKNPKTQDFMHPRILVFFLSSLLQIIWFHGLAILLGCDHGRIHIAHQGDPGFVHRHPSRTSHQNILWLQICVDDATHPVPRLNRKIWRRAVSAGYAVMPHSFKETYIDHTLFRGPQKATPFWSASKFCLANLMCRATSSPNQLGCG